MGALHETVVWAVSDIGPLEAEAREYLGPRRDGVTESEYLGAVRAVVKQREMYILIAERAARRRSTE